MRSPRTSSGCCFEMSCTVPACQYQMRRGSKLSACGVYRSSSRASRATIA